MREDTDQEQLRRWPAALPGIGAQPRQRRLVPSRLRPAHPAGALRHGQPLRAFGLEDDDREAALTAAGALLRYLTTLTLRRPAQVTTLRFSARGDRLLLDEETLRNLEVFRTFRGERGAGTLVHHIDGTVTPLGRRLLELRLAEALTDLRELEPWHAGVAAALADRAWRDGPAGHPAAGRRPRPAGRPRGHRAHRPGAAAPAGRRPGRRWTSCARPPPRADHADHPVARWLGPSVPDFGDLAARLQDACPTMPPANAAQQRLHRRRASTRSWTAAAPWPRTARASWPACRPREREGTGISTLKVGFNKVFGYYFEVTNKHLDKVPGPLRAEADPGQRRPLPHPELKEAEQHHPRGRGAGRGPGGARSSAQLVGAGRGAPGRHPPGRRRRGGQAT